MASKNILPPYPENPKTREGESTAVPEEQDKYGPPPDDKPDPDQNTDTIETSSLTGAKKSGWVRCGGSEFTFSSSIGIGDEVVITFDEVFPNRTGSFNTSLNFKAWNGDLALHISFRPQSSEFIFTSWRKRDEKWDDEWRLPFPDPIKNGQKAWMSVKHVSNYKFDVIFCGKKYHADSITLANPVSFYYDASNSDNGRSTMAEGVFRSLCSSSQQHSSLIDEIDSAGMGAYHLRDPPDHRTMATLRRHGIMNYNHAARQVTKEDFYTFDYILAMDQYNLKDLLRLRDNITTHGSTRGANGSHNTRSTAGKSSNTDDAVSKIAEIRLFGDFNSDGTVNKQIGGGQEIEDPYYGGIDGFEIAYEQATKFSKGFLTYLEKQREQ